MNSRPHEDTIMNMVDNATTPALPPTATARPTRELPRLRRILLRFAVLVVALLSTFGITTALAGPASANYTVASGGSLGYLQYSGSTGSIVAFSGYRFVVPVLSVYRNGRINADLQQEVMVDYSLQRWNGSTWVIVGGTQLRKAIPMGAKSAYTFPALTLFSQVWSPGYFKVVTTVAWGSSLGPLWTGAYTGYQTWAPNQTMDMVCGLAACQNRVVSNGSLYVAG